jgi:hypothetical protein
MQSGDDSRLHEVVSLQIATRGLCDANRAAVDRTLGAPPSVRQRKQRSDRDKNRDDGEKVAPELVEGPDEGCRINTLTRRFAPPSPARGRGFCQ